jgi:hypothetical protein
MRFRKLAVSILDSLGQQVDEFVFSSFDAYMKVVAGKFATATRQESI